MCFRGHRCTRSHRVPAGKGRDVFLFSRVQGYGPRMDQGQNQRGPGVISFHTPSVTTVHFCPLFARVTRLSQMTVVLNSRGGFPGLQRCLARTCVKPKWVGPPKLQRGFWFLATWERDGEATDCVRAGYLPVLPAGMQSVLPPVRVSYVEATTARIGLHFI